MTDIQPAHLSFGGEGRDRNSEHLVALREARIASDYRAATPETEPRSSVAPRFGFIARLRLAVAVGPAMTNDACNCPA